MKVSNETDGGRTVELHQAILIYRGSASAATIHGIAMDESDRPTLMAGKAITAEDARGAMEAIAAGANGNRRSTFADNWLDPRIVYRSSKCLAWVEPPRVAPILFKCSQTDDHGERVANCNVHHRQTVTWPGLFIVARGRSLFMWALTPWWLGLGVMPDTELHYAPFYNVYQNGAMCMGGVRTPKSPSPANLEKYNAGIYRSVFTHSCYSPFTPLKDLTWPQFWRKMRTNGNRPKTYNCYLKQSGKTVKQAIQSVEKGAEEGYHD